MRRSAGRRSEHEWDEETAERQLLSLGRHSLSVQSPPGIVSSSMSPPQGNFTPSFELAMARKDFGLMLELAGARPLAALPGIAARMDQLIANGHGADDVTTLAKDAVAR